MTNCVNVFLKNGAQVSNNQPVVAVSGMMCVGSQPILRQNIFAFSGEKEPVLINDNENPGQDVRVIVVQNKVKALIE